MALPLDRLKTNFVVAQPGATGAAIAAQLPPEGQARDYTYALLPAMQGGYIVVFWRRLVQLAQRAGQDIASVVLEQLPGLPPASMAVERADLSEQDARQLRRSQPNRRLVVLENGAVVGLFAEELRGEGEETFTHAEPLQVPPASEPAAPPTEDDRAINAWLDGQPEDRALEVGQTYQLKFNVASPRKGGVSAGFNAAGAFAGLPPDVQQVEITVALETEDFDISGADQQIMIVPRTGPSKNEPTFAITPKRNGPGTIDALFFVNGHVFQHMQIALQVGPVMQVTSSGLTLGSAVPATRATDNQRQELNLLIIKRDTGYQFRLQNGVSTRAIINLGEAAIADMVARARSTFRELVYLLQDNQYVYQNADTRIAPEVHAESLKKLARLGVYLYQKIFFAPGNGADARAMGQLLRDLSQQQRLSISVVAEHFTFPWALLYDRPFDENNVDPEGFWGFKHIVAYLPEFSTATLINFDPHIHVDGALALGFVCNTTIDDDLKRNGFAPAVAPQASFLQSLAGVHVSTYTTISELYTLLNNPDLAAQLLYFYCHAESVLPSEAGGVDDSRVILSDGPATLEDLNIYAGTDGAPLKHAPLVFLNACQSAELSPYLYDGLVPYMIAKGARGVLGTEVDTPALFAAEFAQAFLQRFVAGNQPLGELLLDLRREYLTEKNNVMGLVYALYSSGDVVVTRAG
ncbi:MAG TPA: CHAT domain-containing protein [Roseiflexaceae bacterium]|nr:CHAT domain-containing protein [Roseiflexaceae bacterium]